MPRKNETREKVLSAAVEVFSRNGYAKATMDEIATAAGVAKGSLYYNFPNKARLFESIYAEGYRMAKNRIGAVLASDASPEEIIERVARILAGLFLEFPDLATILFYTIPPELDSETYDAVLQIRENFIGLVAQLISQGREEGMLKDLDSDLTAAGLLSLTLAVCLRNLKGSPGRDARTSSKKTVEIVVELIMGGIMKRR